MLIPLTNSYLFAEIDEEDYYKVCKYSWYLRIDGGKNKAIARTCDGKSLHRFLLNLTRFNNCNVDHIDGNILNNKKLNLRKASCTQNQRNRKISSNNISGYKGVIKGNYDGEYRAIIYIDRAKISLGYFKDKVLAAIAYDDAAINYFGEFAKLNFPLYGA